MNKPSKQILSKGSRGKSDARVDCWVLQGVLPVEGEMGCSGNTRAAVSAGTPPQALAGKCALVLYTHGAITEQFSVSYCSEAYEIRSSAVISVTPH